MSATPVLDTHRIVKRLRDAGMPEPQAETWTDILRETRELDLAELATKADLAVLRGDLAELRRDLKGDVTELRREVKGDLQLLEQRMTIIEQRLTIKLGGIVVAVAAALGAFLKLFPGAHP